MSGLSISMHSSMELAHFLSVSMHDSVLSFAILRAALHRISAGRTSSDDLSARSETSRADERPSMKAASGAEMAEIRNATMRWVFSRSPGAIARAVAGAIAGAIARAIARAIAVAGAVAGAEAGAEAEAEAITHRQSRHRSHRRHLRPMPVHRHSCRWIRIRIRIRRLDAILAHLRCSSLLPASHPKSLLPQSTPRV